MKVHGYESRVPRHQPPRRRLDPHAASPPSTSAACASASTSRRSPSRSCPRRTTPAAASCTDLDGRDRRRRVSTPAARSPAPGSTAPTASPRTRCSRAWSSAIAPPAARVAALARDRARAARDARLGPGHGRRQRRGRRRHPELGRDPPLHVELRRHRAQRPPPRPRPRAHRSCCGRRSAATTGTCCSPAISPSCATSPPSPS